jgi:hypothetical protein
MEHLRHDSWSAGRATALRVGAAWADPKVRRKRARKVVLTWSQAHAAEAALVQCKVRSVQARERPVVALAQVRR